MQNQLKIERVLLAVEQLRLDFRNMEDKQNKISEDPTDIQSCYECHKNAKNSNTRIENQVNVVKTAMDRVDQDVAQNKRNEDIRVINDTHKGEPETQPEVNIGTKERVKTRKRNTPNKEIKSKEKQKPSQPIINTIQPICNVSGNNTSETVYNEDIDQIKNQQDPYENMMAASIQTKANNQQANNEQNIHQQPDSKANKEAEGRITPVSFLGHGRAKTTMEILADLLTGTPLIMNHQNRAIKIQERYNYVYQH